MNRGLVLGVLASAFVATGCSDVAFGISTNNPRGRANVIVVFGNQVTVVARLISSTSGSAGGVESTVAIVGADADFDVTADSMWLAAGTREWGFALNPGPEDSSARTLTAVGPMLPWPPGTRVDARIRWRRGQRTQVVELTGLMVEAP